MTTLYQDTRKENKGVVAALPDIQQVMITSEETVVIYDNGTRDIFYHKTLEEYQARVTLTLESS